MLCGCSWPPTGLALGRLARDCVPDVVVQLARQCVRSITYRCLMCGIHADTSLCYAAVLKGWFDRTLVPGEDCAWDFPRSQAEAAASNGLVPKLTNIKRMLTVSTYGAPRKIVYLAGDNGRNWCGICPCLVCVHTLSTWRDAHGVAECVAVHAL